MSEIHVELVDPALNCLQFGFGFRTIIHTNLDIFKLNLEYGFTWAISRMSSIMSEIHVA